MSDFDSIEIATKSKTKVKVDMFYLSHFYYDSIRISYQCPLGFEIPNFGV
jgi:hypothetical protein